MYQFSLGGKFLGRRERKGEKRNRKVDFYWNNTWKQKQRLNTFKMWKYKMEEWRKKRNTSMTMPTNKIQIRELCKYLFSFKDIHKHFLFLFCFVGCNFSSNLFSIHIGYCCSTAFGSDAFVMMVLSYCVNAIVIISLMTTFHILYIQWYMLLITF